MCLIAVFEKPEPPDAREYEGHKSVQLRDSRGYFRSRWSNDVAGCSPAIIGCDRLYMFNRWYRDTEVGLLGCGNATYRTGFHVFRARRSAVAWGSNTREVVVRVRYRQVVARGTESPIQDPQGHLADVAREIMFLPKDGFQPAELSRDPLSGMILVEPINEET